MRATEPGREQRMDMASRMRQGLKGARAAAVGAGLMFAPVNPSLAGHDVFHIFTPVIEQGEIGTEALTAIQSDLAGQGGETRAAHEVAIHGDVTDVWMAKLALGLQKPVLEDYNVNTIALENVFRLPGFHPQGYDAGWFTGLSAGLDGAATNAVEFGPVVTVDAGPVALAFNPFFEKTFGQNREDGLAFGYGWRATYGLAHKLSIGVEGYGDIENIANAPDVRDQIHRAGPVLYLGHVHGAARDSAHEPAHGHEEKGLDSHAEIGVLFGLTPATPGLAIKLNVGADF